MNEVKPNIGPPYVSATIATVGGRPTVNTDVPICAVLIFVYLAGGIANQIIYQRNRRRGYKFPMSWLMFGFCMARVGTGVMRLVWATRPTNARIAIAALIFTNIGVLIIYIVLFLLALRTLADRCLYHLILLTLNTTLKSVALWIQRVSILYMLIFNVMFLVLLLLSVLLPCAPDHENFGTGGMTSKFIVLGVATFFSVFIAGFRAGTAWSAPRLASNPAWFDSKAAFYVVLFGFEIIILHLLLFTCFDRRF